MAAAAAETHFLQFAIQWASITILYYDYFLTLPREIKYIWRGRKRVLLVVLYVLCRYALLANVLYLLVISNKLGGPTSCNLVYMIIGVISALGRTAVIVTFLIRVYVVCAKSKIVLGGLGIIGLACVVLDFVHVAGIRCEGSPTIKIVNKLLAIMVCVFESLVTSAILFRSIQALHFRSPTFAAERHTFSYLVVEQGVLYFAFISCFTIGAVVLTFRAPGGFYQRLLNAFTLPLSGLLTARFLLRLRAYHERSIGLHLVNIEAMSVLSTFEVAMN